MLSWAMYTLLKVSILNIAVRDLMRQSAPSIYGSVT